jgi:hypothetical protein
MERKRKTYANKTILFCCISLIVIVFLEFLFIQFTLFETVPYIGIGFHLVGGMAVGVGVYYVFLPYMIQLPWFMKTFHIIAAVGLAAIGREGFEWLVSIFYYNNLQGDLNNTMGDLYVGLLGGLVATMYIVIKERKI